MWIEYLEKIDIYVDYMEEPRFLPETFMFWYQGYHKSTGNATNKKMEQFPWKVAYKILLFIYNILINPIYIFRYNLYNNFIFVLSDCRWASSVDIEI